MKCSSKKSMNKILKIYVWYTENIKEYIEILQESSKELENIEIIPYLHLGPTDDPNLKMGETHKESYKKLMLIRWKVLPSLIEENMGENIVWLDADCVFNKNNKTFYETINNELTIHDFVFQYDDNSGLIRSINTGVMGIKCSDKTLNMINKFYEDISTTTDLRDGYPLLEINEMFDKYSIFGTTYSLLPQDFCKGEGNWVIYHAVSCHDKIQNLRSKL